MYTTVFQVSDRLVEIPLGAAVLILAAIATTLMVIHHASDTIPRIAAVLLATGGLACGLLLAHHSQIGDWTAAVFVALWFCFWVYVLQDEKIRNKPSSALLRTRFVWFFRLAPVLLLVALGARGVAEFPALALSHRLASGEGTVRSGVVERIAGQPNLFGCFWLEGQEYCYDASELGYSVTPGGPIATGDTVRITWLGDTIVKVELLRASP